MGTALAVVLLVLIIGLQLVGSEVSNEPHKVRERRKRREIQEWRERQRQQGRSYRL